MSIKIEVDAAVLAKAEEFAYKQNTSVAGLLNNYLHEIARSSDTRKAARKRIAELSRDAQGEVGERTWTRDSLYAR